MRKDELVNENRRLKKDLSEVCEHHKRLTKILYQKIDEICELKKRLTKIESLMKIDEESRRGGGASGNNMKSLMKTGKEGKKASDDNIKNSTEAGKEGKNR